MKEFYSMKESEVLKNLGTKKDGLSQEKANELLQKNGKNKLAEAKKKTPLQKFFSQFKDVMIIILLIAAAVSIVMAFLENDSSSLIEGGIILLIVLLNAIMGYVQENKAENALENLKKSTQPYCEVIRDGETLKIKSEDLVVGDIVV